MKISALALPLAAAFALSAGATFAAEFAGGAIKTMTIDGQEVLVGPNDMTLYTFANDTPGVTNCYAQCAVNWPPLFADDGAVAEGDFTLVERTDGPAMWAYKGMPLYFWVKDENPGDTTGDGVGGNWHTAVLE